ncbi:MAG: acyl--CoA ligase [Lachnospiraceae bacterium]|nr:acyl--CoA ligase [Lachnospiraceae bacterium]
MDYTYDVQSYKKVFESSFSWISQFMRNVRRYPDSRAVIDPVKEQIWTYKDLNTDVNKLANFLLEKGVKPSDVVFFQLYNSPQFVMCYIAPQKIGAIDSPVNFNFSAQETANLIDRDKPKVYVYDTDVSEMAVRALELCENKPEIVLAVDYRGNAGELPAGHYSFGEILASGNGCEPDVEFEHDMYMEVTRLSTSGTTGTPKGIPLNNINEVLSAHDTIMSFPLSPRDVTMNMTPWFHRGGLHSGGPNPTLYVGGCVVVMRMFSPKYCFEYTKKYGITFLIGAPAALVKLADRQQKHPEELPTLKGIVTMGAPLEKEECIRFLKTLTPNIFNGYGTTETFWNTFLRPYDLPDMSGTAGRSCIGDEVRVVNIYPDRKADPDDMVPMDGKSTGEIIIFAPEKTAMCYVANEEQTKEKYSDDGWFYTKDVGTWDANQYISITGRKDNMIICMGENIYPEQLEEVINQNERVKDCMIIGVDDPSRGQSVAAYILPADDTLTVQDINAFCTNHDAIAYYKCPRYYAIVSELPYNATGKKLHNVLRAGAKDDLVNGVLRRP